MRPMRIVDRRFDLSAVADDAGIGDQTLDVLLSEPCDLVEVEAGKSLAEILALAEDRQPGQARLEAFEAYLLEEPLVVDDRPSPLPIMICGVFRDAAMPGAACLAVLSLDQSLC